MPTARPFLFHRNASPYTVSVDANVPEFARRKALYISRIVMRAHALDTEIASRLMVAAEGVVLGKTLPAGYVEAVSIQVVAAVIGALDAARAAGVKDGGGLSSPGGLSPGGLAALPLLREADSLLSTGLVDDDEYSLEANTVSSVSAAIGVLDALRRAGRLSPGGAKALPLLREAGSLLSGGLEVEDGDSVEGSAVSTIEAVIDTLDAAHSARRLTRSSSKALPLLRSAAAQLREA